MIAGLATLLACGTAVDPELRLAGDAEVGWYVELSGIGRAELAALDAASSNPTAGTATNRQATLAVYTLATPRPTGEETSRPAVLGRVDVEGAIARWNPTYPLVAGQRYRAAWRGIHADSSSESTLSLEFSLPTAEVPSTTVVAGIYPSTDKVPANLLRLYIQFSAPMSQGRASEYVEVFADGEVLEGAFVVPQQELWSPAGDRLTLFFDPGRLKLEVGPNLEVGAPLSEGQEVIVRVSSDWPDAGGGPLEKGFEKRYRVVSADRTQPDPSTWKLVPPAAADEPVTLELPEALDRALLERLIVVESSSGEPIAGRIEVAAGETVWTFHPERPWPAGNLRLRVRPELEDLGGNSLERMFDEPLDDSRVGEVPMGDVLIPFSRAVSGP